MAPDSTVLAEYATNYFGFRVDIIGKRPSNKTAAADRYAWHPECSCEQLSKKTAGSQLLEMTNYGCCKSEVAVIHLSSMAGKRLYLY